MKKILHLILSLLLIFSIAGCSGQQTSQTDMSLDDMIGVTTKKSLQYMILSRIGQGLIIVSLDGQPQTVLQMEAIRPMVF